MTMSTPEPPAPTPSATTDPTLGNILLPRDRADALAFLNGMLAAYDNPPLRRADILAARQHYFDLPVEP